MKKFIIERNLPGAGNLTPDELEAMSKTSNAAIIVLNKSYRWVQSFVTEDKIYCVYIAQYKELIKEHAAKGGFPANRVEEVSQVISPVTAE